MTPCLIRLTVMDGRAPPSKKSRNPSRFSKAQDLTSPADDIRFERGEMLVATSVFPAVASFRRFGFSKTPGLFTRPAASHPRKGKPFARAGRKAKGHTGHSCLVAAAWLPKGWNDLRPQNRRSSDLIEDDEASNQSLSLCPCLAGRRRASVAARGEARSSLWLCGCPD